MIKQRRRYHEKYEAKVISHPYSQGNGAAIKTGARNATGDITVFMDGDGQHNPVDIPMFLQKMEEGYDMVVGARNVKSQASLLRRIGNAFYNSGYGFCLYADRHVWGRKQLGNQSEKMPWCWW
jgi:glycosyltransferase involved in cell wall biosynthesis